MKLTFTGIQGCGKGTQARLLMENYGFKIVEMGQVFRDIAKEDNELGKNVKKAIDNGYLVDEKDSKEVFKNTLESETHDKVIYDGFPRNMKQKEIADKIMGDYKVVIFELSKKKAIERLLGRMYDPISGETFKSGTIKNPETGTKLIKRKDDNEESIINRINAFVEKTIPMVELQKTEGKVIEINADQSVKNVYKELTEKLGL